MVGGYVVILSPLKKVPDLFSERHCAFSVTGMITGHFLAFAAFSARAAAPAVASRGIE